MWKIIIFPAMNKSLVTNFIALAFIAAGYLSPWAAEELRTVGFFAFSGAITNWLAVYMLFERVPLLYGSGVIPRHFEEIKTGLREMMIREFFSPERVETFMEETAMSLAKDMDVTGIIESIDLNGAFDILKEEILQSNIGGMLGMFGGVKLLENYREPFISKTIAYIRSELESPEILSHIMGASLEHGGEALIERVTNLVQTRLDELTPKQIKQIVQDMIRQHLGWLVVWGGVFGGIIGLLMGFLQRWI